ncbi:MAG: hypothetical protein R3F43_27495 [bacterium]
MRVIDCYVEDVDAGAGPTCAERRPPLRPVGADGAHGALPGDLRTGRRGLGLGLPGGRGGPGRAPPARAHPALRRRDPCLADPAQGAVALVPLARWLGLEGPPMPHHYTFQLIAGAEGGVVARTRPWPPRCVTTPTPRCRGGRGSSSRSRWGPRQAWGWTSLTGTSPSVWTGSGTSEATTHHYFSPAAFTSAHYSYHAGAARPT